MRLFLVMTLIALPALALPVVETWERGAKTRSTVNLAKAPQLEVTRADAQVGRTHHFRGVRLQALIDQAAPAPNLDLVLLHFKNGMVVPLPFRDDAVMKQLDPMIALALKDENGWTAGFPPLAKRGAASRDNRPITFDGNKLVVSSLAHPLQLKAIEAASPFLHVDSLTGLEFAVSAKWDAQFEVGDTPELRAGQRIFLSRCQFCHGVKKVGASYGWDFVEPIPLSQHRSPKSLALHVMYREGDAPEKGLMMPAVGDLSERDLANVWKWLEAVGKSGPRAYAP